LHGPSLSGCVFQYESVFLQSYPGQLSHRVRAKKRRPHNNSTSRPPKAGVGLFTTGDNMLESTFSYLISGTVFGLFAGIAPGPLLTLVVAETLRRSVRDGIKVALAPALTDLPIVLVSVLMLAKFRAYDIVIGMISLAGGTYLTYLGYECITATGLDLNKEGKQPSSLRKGVITNFLNPHPYLFWISVGAPTIIKGAHLGLQAPALFLAGFYVCIIGAKIAVALIVGRFSRFLRSRAYTLTMKALGLALLVFAFLFFRDGLALLGFQKTGGP